LLDRFFNEGAIAKRKLELSLRIYTDAACKNPL